jgi:outer membrane protein assembly factor BamB
MKKICLMMLGILCCSFTPVTEFRDYDFQQERMLTAEDGIYLISSFEDSDHVTAYSYYGELLWNTSFYAKITSWRVVGDRIIVFSKHRNGYKTYLTCLDRYTGQSLWQRP